MWCFLNDAFLSIVAPDAKRLTPEQLRQDLLLVRSRFGGDIERVFGSDFAVEPTARTDYARDYAFRALIPRAVVEQAMLTEVKRIDYGNFKGSTREDWRHDVYMRCWVPMKAEQDRRHPRAPLARRAAIGYPFGHSIFDPRGFLDDAGIEPPPKRKRKARKGGAKLKAGMA